MEGQNKFGLYGLKRSPHLTVVALKVIILVHRHDPEDLFTALKHRTGQNGDFSMHFLSAVKKLKFMKDKTCFEILIHL